jgi:hypothetical protein
MARRLLPGGLALADAAFAIFAQAAIFLGILHTALASVTGLHAFNAFGF